MLSIPFLLMHETTKRNENTATEDLSFELSKHQFSLHMDAAGFNTNNIADFAFSVVDRDLSGSCELSEFEEVVFLLRCNSEPGHGSVDILCRAYRCMVDDMLLCYKTIVSQLLVKVDEDKVLH